MFLVTSALIHPIKMSTLNSTWYCRDVEYLGDCYAVIALVGQKDFAITANHYTWEPALTVESVSLHIHEQSIDVPIVICRQILESLLLLDWFPQQALSIVLTEQISIYPRTSMNEVLINRTMLYRIGQLNSSR